MNIIKIISIITDHWIVVLKFKARHGVWTRHIIALRWNLGSVSYSSAVELTGGRAQQQGSWASRMWMLLILNIQMD